MHLLADNPQNWQASTNHYQHTKQQCHCCTITNSHLKHRLLEVECIFFFDFWWDLCQVKKAIIINRDVLRQRASFSSLIYFEICMTYSFDGSPQNYLQHHHRTPHLSCKWFLLEASIGPGAKYDCPL